MSAQGWGPQGGYPPQPQGGYPPQPQGGYPPQPQGGYPPQAGMGGWTQAYPPTYGGGYGGGQPGGSPGGGRPGGKSALLILGIVVATVVFLVAVGGIFIALSGGPASQASAPITPDASPPPSSRPSPKPSSTPTRSASASPRPSSGGGGQTGGQAGGPIDLSHDIVVRAASGWQVENTKDDLAVLTNGREIFVGQVAELSTDADPRQVVDSYHRQLGREYTNVEYQQATSVDLGSKKLSGAHGAMTGTSSGGQGSSEVVISSLASVRKSDGVTVVGTIYYSSSSDADQLAKDYSAMVSSMLASQAKG